MAAGRTGAGGEPAPYRLADAILRARCRRSHRGDARVDSGEQDARGWSGAASVLHRVLASSLAVEPQLHRGRLAEGPHRIEWNGRDDRGRRVAAGIYFVRFEVPGRRMEAKLVKLR